MAGTWNEPPPISLYCGDGVRDPVTEECDDFAALAAGACTSDCRVQSTLAVESTGTSSSFSRSLQGGNQAIGASSQGFAVAFLEGVADPTLYLAAFDSSGVSTGAPTKVSLGSTVAAHADPAVVALSDQRFVVAWVGRPSGTGDILLRAVDLKAANQLSPVVMVHDLAAGAQQQPALISIGQELIVAWEDSANLKYRRFSQSLAPLGLEQPLAVNSDFETSVSVASFAGGWAAAWRVSSELGERVRVKTGNKLWETEIFAPGPVGDRPALVAIDASHLLVVVSTGGLLVSGSDVRYAILDTAATGSVVTTAILPMTSPYAESEGINRKRPSAAFHAGRVYVGWETESPMVSAFGQEPFFQELSWSADSPQTLTPVRELPFIVNSPRTGDQVSPLLTLMPRRYSAALATVWVDASGQLAERPTSDLIVGIRPLPLVILPLTIE